MTYQSLQVNRENWKAYVECDNPDPEGQTPNVFSYMKILALKL